MNRDEFDKLVSVIETLVIWIAESANPPLNQNEAVVLLQRLQSLKENV